MYKAFLLVVFVAVILLSWSLGATAVKRDAAGANRQGTFELVPLIDGDEGTPTEQRYCWMQWNPWVSYSYYSMDGWQTNEIVASWVNPGDYGRCSDLHPYPFLIRGARLRVGHSTATYPDTLQLLVLSAADPADSCAGPKEPLEILSSGTFVIPSLSTYILLLATPYCTNEPVYMAARWIGNKIHHPSFLFSIETNPTTLCANWDYYDPGTGFQWYEWIDGGYTGNLFFRILGESQSPLCTTDPVFGIQTVASSNDSVTVISACAGDVIHIPNIAITSYNGYTGTVKMEWTDLPAEVDSAKFVPPIVNVTTEEPSVTDGYIYTKSTLAPGNYYMDIKATDTTDTNLNRETFIWAGIKSNDYRTGVTSLVEVIAGQDVVVTDTVTALCFAFPVTLSVSGLPTGATLTSINPNGVIPLQTGTEFDITISTTSSVAAGRYDITITATGGDTPPTIHQEYFTLWVHPSNYCTMQRHYRGYWGFYGIDITAKIANWYDLTDTNYANCADPLPVKVMDATWWYYYATNRHKLPTTLKVVLWDAADSCAGPLADVRIGESDPLTKTTAVAGWAQEPVFFTFSEPVCINKNGFFAGVEYISCARDSCLGYTSDGTDPTDTCATWVYDKTAAYPDSTWSWYEGIFYQGGTDLGYHNLKLGMLMRGAGCICGDPNEDGVVNLADIIYLINYVYYDGAPPPDLTLADVDSNGIIDIGDIVHLINYIYYSGCIPVCQL
jgi:hypothetical protein